MVFFLIINQNREISEIKDRIYTLFAPIEEEYKGFEDTISKAGLRYELIHFESRKKVERCDLNRIYKKVIKDVKLYSRINNHCNLFDYIQKQLE